jgi:hypothetical protein
MKGEEVMSVGTAAAGLPAGGSRHHVRGRARVGGIKFGAALFGWITAIWLWAVIMTAVAAVTVAVAGPMLTDGTGLSGLPRIPIDEGTLTAGGALLLIAAALITLAAAVLGGKAGMHYHRKIDRAEADPALPATP